MTKKSKIRAFDDFCFYSDKKVQFIWSINLICLLGVIFYQNDDGDVMDIQAVIVGPCKSTTLASSHTNYLSQRTLPMKEAFSDAS